MNFKELRNFLENQMIMMENYQPVMIKSLIQHNGKATKQEIIQDLQNKNPDLPKEHFDNSPVFKVLTSTHHVAQFNNSEKTYEMLDYETYTKEEKEWITNFCITKISTDLVGLKYWVWPVEQGNWPTVKDKKKWAVGKKGKGKRVKKGDKIIFFKVQSGFFVGVFSVESDWHERTVVWPDQKHGSETMTTGAEIDLEIIQLGFAAWSKLWPDLEFVKKKSPKVRGLYLRGHTAGPANAGKPISPEDYNLILEELIKVQKEPIAAKAAKTTEEEEVTQLADMSDHEFELDKLPDPVKKTIEDIFKDVEKGKVAVPKFQRYWTWNRQQIEELWESIFRSFQAG